LFRELGRGPRALAGGDDQDGDPGHAISFAFLMDCLTFTGALRRYFVALQNNAYIMDF
jgi:hypothetical protein